MISCSIQAPLIKVGYPQADTEHRGVVLWLGVSKRDDDKGPKPVHRAEIHAHQPSYVRSCHSYSLHGSSRFRLDLVLQRFEPCPDPDTLGARATVALYFRDAESARVILSSLSSQPHTVKASIYFLSGPTVL